jgi:RNA polymerase sigma factor (sigma-70 family)
MATTQANTVLRHLNRLLEAPNHTAPSDRQLLEQFGSCRDEAAFTALVRRHGPLVHGVCRRVLGNGHDAEDAFQAAFLLLARKAASIRQESVAGWLYQVAVHVALRARSQRATRVRHEQQASGRRPPDPLAEVTAREVLSILDEELHALPLCHRAPLVLCYLEGRTRDEAARQLGWSLGTLKRRLEGGKERLHARLARRGLTLGASLLTAGLGLDATAAVPAPLVSTTVRAALAGKAVSVRVAALAGAALTTASAARLKATVVLAACVAVLAAATLTYPVSSQPPAATASAAPAREGEPAPPPAPVPSVTGRVLDANGKPLAGARVAASGTLRLGQLSVEYREEALGETKADAEGRFSLPLSRASGKECDAIKLLVRAPGHGLGWRYAIPAAAGRGMELRLPAERVATGRLIDLQGQPAVGVKLRPVRLGLGSAERPKLPGKDGMQLPTPPPPRDESPFHFTRGGGLSGSALWPALVTSGADGCFRLTSFGLGQEMVLLVEDDRFARQAVTVRNDGKEGEARFALAPPQRVAGCVVAADTGQPVAGAWVLVTSWGETHGEVTDGQTDADGRFTGNAYKCDRVTVEVFPPRGQPYLASFRDRTWPKGSVQQEIDVRLPRGVLVRGWVVEQHTGRPVDSANIRILPQVENNPRLPLGLVHLSATARKAFSGPDGRFEAVVPVGPCRLLTTGPNPDYVYCTISEGELRAGRPGGGGREFHAVTRLDLRADDSPQEVVIELRRAVTVKGRVVGPDGKPVPHAVLFVPGELAPPSPPEIFVPGLPAGTRFSALAVHGGAFELRNCEPDKTYRIYFLDSNAPPGPPRIGDALDHRFLVNRLFDRRAGRLGAVVDFTAKPGAEPVVAKLVACGSAELHFVDARGRPRPQKFWLELLVRPGPSVAKARAEGKPAAEAALLASPHAVFSEGPPLVASAEGRVGVPALIPGATYRIKLLAGPVFEENELVLEKDFAVESGKTAKLEIVVPAGH